MSTFLDKIPMLALSDQNNKTRMEAIPLPFESFQIFCANRQTIILRYFPGIRKAVAADEMHDMGREKRQKSIGFKVLLLIRRSLWEEIGGFDERYFLFMSDAELCQEAWRRGKKVMYFPHTTVTADGKRCSEGGF